eukprot:3480795-Amphidinium_carterae.1
MGKRAKCTVEAVEIVESDDSDEGEAKKARGSNDAEPVPAGPTTGKDLFNWPRLCVERLLGVDTYLARLIGNCECGIVSNTDYSGMGCHEMALWCHSSLKDSQLFERVRKGPQSFDPLHLSMLFVSWKLVCFMWLRARCLTQALAEHGITLRVSHHRACDVSTESGL